MKTIVTALMAVATLAGGLTATTSGASAQPWYPGPYHHHHYRGYDRGDVAGAAALGLVGGMILGGVAAQSAQPSYGYGYGDEYVVRRSPRRTYVYEDDYSPRRVTRCRVFTKYDMYGRPYEYKDCDP